MASKILKRFKQQIQALELEPSQGGCFEIAVDSSTLYSKLETGQFPDEGKILNEIEKRLR